MSRLETLEREIAKLSHEEFVQLRDHILDRDWDEWDAQIERDAAAGKLDRLFKKSLDDHAAGKSAEI